MAQAETQPANDQALQLLRTAPGRPQIDALQRCMVDMPQVDLPAQHTFGPGFYARTITIPKGTILVGKVHATEHLFIVSKGEIALATEDGVKVVSAPFQCVARPGLKRVGVAITDVVCTNVHITTETRLDRLEASLIVPEMIGLQGTSGEVLQ